MIRTFLLWAVVAFISSSCGMSLPATTTSMTTQSPVTDTPNTAVPQQSPQPHNQLPLLLRNNPP